MNVWMLGQAPTKGPLRRECHQKQNSPTLHSSDQYNYLLDWQISVILCLPKILGYWLSGAWWIKKWSLVLELPPRNLCTDWPSLYHDLATSWPGNVVCSLYLRAHVLCSLKMRQLCSSGLNLLLCKFDFLNVATVDLLFLTCIVSSLASAASWSPVFATACCSCHLLLYSNGSLMMSHLPTSTYVPLYYVTSKALLLTDIRTWTPIVI